VLKPGPLKTRREFLAGAAASAAAAAFFPNVLAAAKTKRLKKAAMLITEVRKHSHGQHFLDRFLEGYGWEGAHHHPEVDLVSIYVDQFPQNDLSRDREKRFKCPIHKTIADALTLGTSRLAVDGVIIIAEHGRYPKNEKGQTQYPRHEFMRQTVDVFKSSGRAVPVFNDKHLSTDWQKCVEMVRWSKDLNFPFLAGSSLPVTCRLPAIDITYNTPLKASVCVGYGGIDSYDFHGIETAQCMSERRKGGEAGIKSVHALRGPAVWKRLDEDDLIQRLFLAALSRSETRVPPAGYTFAPPTMHEAKDHARDPIGYFYEHNDGFRTATFLLNGYVSDFSYAGLRKDNDQIISCIMYLPMPGATATTADFFNPLCNHIERMILEDRAPYPVERTLLTSGMTLTAVDSLHRGQVELATPQLKVEYKAPVKSNFWRA
jgi:hypothetical protein